MVLFSDESPRTDRVRQALFRDEWLKLLLQDASKDMRDAKLRLKRLWTSGLEERGGSVKDEVVLAIQLAEIEVIVQVQHLSEQGLRRLIIFRKRYD